MSFPRYPKYKDSGVEWLGDVPEYWTRFRLQFLLMDGKDGIRIGPFGSSVKLEDMVPAGFKVYGQENVIYRDFSLGERFVSESKFLELADYEIKIGDVLVTMAGTAGRCQIVPKGINRGIMDSHLVRMRFQATRAWPPLIPYLIEKSKYVIDQLVVAGRGSTMHGLNSTIIKKLEVCLPPVEEQRRITAFLDRETAKIDELVAEQRRLIELLKEKRQAVISHAVTKGLNPHVPLKPSGIEWLGDVPAHWTVKSLSMSSKRIAVGLATSVTQFYRDEGVPIIRNMNIKEGYFDGSDMLYLDDSFAQSQGSKAVFGGDVLVVHTGSNLGLACVVPDTYHKCHTFTTLIVTPCEDLLNHFLVYCINSAYGKTEVDRLKVGFGKDNLNVGEFKCFNTVLPTFNEQEATVSFLDTETARIDALMTEAERAIDLLQERRTALISAAVTGKIDVRGLVESEAA